MESAEELNSSKKQTLIDWLELACQGRSFSLQPMAADASVRRYYRLTVQDQTYVVMDASLDVASVEAFMHVGSLLASAGIIVPHVVLAHEKAGYLLLTDFGNQTFKSILTASNVDFHYHQAIEALLLMQTKATVISHKLPTFSTDFMAQEWIWHKEWFVNKFLGLPEQINSEVDEALHHLMQACAMQPQVFMHRDYHSANLMFLPPNGMGMLDFQDAFIGPITYDLVSLLRDCYLSWPPPQVEKWVNHYWQKATAAGLLRNVPFEIFMRWFDWMGMQRHLKALLTFSRKFLRDKQAEYLKHMPRTLNYLLIASGKYNETSALSHWLHHDVKPAFERKSELCEA